MTEIIYWAWHPVKMRWRLKGHIRDSAVNETDTHYQVLTQRRHIYALCVSCWDSSVGIVCRLQAEQVRNRFSISGREVNLPLVQEVQNSSG
jgi:hypothetical protein